MHFLLINHQEFTMADRDLYSSYKQDIPPIAQEKVRLLQDRRAVAKYLETQLIKARAEVSELEEELAPFQIEDHVPDSLLHGALDTSKKLPPIDRLPVEILCLIFEHYLISRHPYIRRLLLVCKRWNQIISTTPRLWARIEVEKAFGLFEFPDQKSRLPYISACIERSGDALLDVELNLRRSITREGYIKLKMQLVAFSLLEEDEIDVVNDRINDQQYTANSPRAFHPFDAAIQLLIGKDDSSLKRWRTLRLELPFDDTQAWVVWEALTGDTTNLTTIHLENVPEEWIEESNRSCLVDLDLSRIQRMSLDAAIPIHYFSVSPKVLQHLEISVDSAFKSIEKLSSFPLLCTLNLDCREDYGEDDYGNPSNIPPSLSICLPQLKNLAINGEYYRLNCINFYLPALQILIVHTGSTKVHQPPKVSPQHIHWIDRYPKTRDEDLVIEGVNTLLLLSKSIRTVTVREAHRTPLLKAVARSKAKQWLRFILVERTDGEVERIDVTDIQKVLSGTNA
jgi:hypothetical protein